MKTFLERTLHRLRIAWAVFRAHPAMPATALWRIYEAEHALDLLGGSGRGLDLGCGDGSFAAVLMPKAPELAWTGIELDPYDALLAEKRGLYDKVHLCPAEQMPFEDDAFTVVFSNCVIEHVHDLDAVLAQVARVLQPGGRFLFSVPRECFYENLVIPRFLAGIGLSKLATRYCRSCDQRLEIVSLLSPEEWQERLAGHGLTVESNLPYATRWTTGWWDLLAAASGGLTYLVSGGPPRRTQQSSGMLERDRPWLGSLTFFLFLPIILLTIIQKTTEPCAGQFIEARLSPLAQRPAMAEGENDA